MIKMFSDQDEMIKPSSIAKPDVVIKDEKDNFMDKEMFLMIRPKVDPLIGMIDKFPIKVKASKPVPQLSDEANRAIVAYDDGVRPKEFRNKMKKHKKKVQIEISHNKTISFD